MTRFIWLFKQITPRTYWTTYGADGQRRVAIWKMWLGRCYDTVDFPVSA